MNDLALPNQSQPLEGVICAGQPSPAQFEAAAAHGVVTVINLRGADEVDRDLAAEVGGAGMAYVHIPITGPADLTTEAAQKLADALDESDGPVLVHCGSSNRVGALMAVKARLIDGKDAEEAIALGESAGLKSLGPVVRTLM